MSSAPETRIWAGRVGGDPSLERNRVYKYDVAGRSAVLQCVRFRAVPFAVMDTPDQAVMAGYLGSGGGFVEAGDVDGVTGWHAPAYLSGLGSISAVAWSPVTRRLVVVAPDSGLWYSDDRGVSFTQVTSWPMYDVVYAPEIGMFLAVGDNRAQFYSADGKNWSMPTPPGTVPFSRLAWSGSLGRFIMTTLPVGGGGGIFSTSDPGVEAVSEAPGILGGLNTPRGITWVEALSNFVVVGDNGLWSKSPTGLSGTWSAPSSMSGSPPLRAVAANPAGRVVAVGAPGVAFYTNDLVSWSGATGPATQMYAVMWSGVTFLAAGVGGELWNALDGTSWALGFSAGGFAYALGLMSPVTYLGALDEPYVNVIHESALRPAASARFPVSLFSIGSVFPVGLMLGETRNIVDIPLRLNWEVGPGDVLRIDTPLGLNVAVEFEAEMIQAPTYGDAPRGF